MKQHIQDKTLTEWEKASDEEHLQGLLQPIAFPLPRWMGHLKQKRSHLVTQYLQLHQATGDYTSQLASKKIKG